MTFASVEGVEYPGERSQALVTSQLERLNACLVWSFEVACGRSDPSIHSRKCFCAAQMASNDLCSQITKSCGFAQVSFLVVPVSVVVSRYTGIVKL